MKKVIGIISYLPDDQQLREYRKNALLNLIGRCNELFDLPIIIVAQNWKDFNIPSVSVYSYKEKLGITGARKELRRIFLQSEYDYLIMLDDDIELVGTVDGSKDYLQQIEEHPGMWGSFKDRSLILFAISKEMFKLVDYPDLEAERGELFEDIYLWLTYNKLYQNKMFRFKRDDSRFNQISEAVNDVHSTWWHHQFDKHEMGDKTRGLVQKL